MLGTYTSEIEVSFASNKGFWLLLDNDELFVAFAEFPWFKKATFYEITIIERPSKNHLYWPLLDIDLAVDSILHPTQFPLIAKELNTVVKRNAPSAHPLSLR